MSDLERHETGPIEQRIPDLEKRGGVPEDRAPGPSENDLLCIEATLTVVDKLGEATVFPPDAARIRRVLLAAKQSDVRLAAQEALIERVKYFRARVEGLEAALRELLDSSGVEFTDVRLDYDVMHIDKDALAAARAALAHERSDKDG